MLLVCAAAFEAGMLVAFAIMQLLDVLVRRKLTLAAKGTTER